MVVGVRWFLLAFTIVGYHANASSSDTSGEISLSDCNVNEIELESAPTLLDCLQRNTDLLLPALRVSDLMVAQLVTFTNVINEHTGNKWHISAPSANSLNTTHLQVLSLKPLKFLVETVQQQTSNETQPASTGNSSESVQADSTEHMTGSIHRTTQLWFSADVHLSSANGMIVMDTLKLDKIKFILEDFALDGTAGVQTGSVSTSEVENTMAFALNDNLVRFSNTLFKWIAKPSTLAPSEKKQTSA